ncbi:MAG: RNA polymerase sigma factor [Pseudomonadota bacterium]
MNLDDFLAAVERKAYRMALLATNNRADALDLVQEAMIKLATRYRDAPEAEWKPLFYRILQNLIRDHYRRAKVLGLIQGWFAGADEEGQESVPSSRHQPLQALEADQAMAALDSALQELPLRQQQVFLLRLWEGLDVKETARVMGCSEGSVKTHYSRAVQTLRDRLGEFWS